MLAKYLAITIARRLEKIGSSGWIQYVLILAAMLIVGGLFWLAGYAGSGNISLIGFFIVMFVGLGGWIGLRNISGHKPSGYYFISRDVWLWSEAAKGKFLAIMLAAVTILPYYISKLVGYSIGETIIFALVLAVAALDVVFIGVVLGIIIRKISNSAPLRLILILLTSFTILTLISYYSFSIAEVESQLFVNPIDIRLLPTLLLFFGVSFVLLILLELLFGSIAITNSPAAQYWAGNRAVRLFRFINKPVSAAMLSSLLYLVRSTTFQRRLLVILLAMLTYPLFSLFFRVQTSHDSTILALVAVFVAAIFYSIPLGKFSSGQETAFAAMPRSKKLHPISELISSTIVITVLSVIFTNLLTPFPGIVSSAIIVCAAVGVHAIMFYSSYLAEQLKRHTATSKGESIIIVGIAASLFVSLMAINFINVAPALLTSTLVILWAAIISWIMARSAHYLKIKQA